MDLKTGIAVLCVTMLIVSMAIVPSVTACSNTPQSAFWGYKYVGSGTIESYGDLTGYLSSVCGGSAVGAAGCNALKEKRIIVICAVVAAAAGCGTYAVVQWDYSSKNSWLRKNCAASDKKLVDVYYKQWWNPLAIPSLYTNARCGC